MNHEHFSQLRYIKNGEGTINMDFIGRFENLEADFKVVAKQLGITDDILPTLLKHNYKRYQDEYTPTTRNLIHEIYKEEIDYFDFEFEE